MAQLNLYVPDELEERIKERAKREGKSVSLFVTDLVRKSVSPRAWTKEFISTFGGWGGEFPEIQSLPEVQRDSFILSPPTNKNMKKR